MIRSIREYSNSKLKKDEQFYENQNLKSKTIYTDGKKELQISYNEAGQEIARMVYNNWNPVEGTEIIGNGSKTYKDGKLVKELNYYQDTNLIFSRKTSRPRNLLQQKWGGIGAFNFKRRQRVSKTHRWLSLFY